MRMSRKPVGFEQRRSIVRRRVRVYARASSWIHGEALRVAERSTWREASRVRGLGTLPLMVELSILFCCL